ncbi:MAG: penicillin-binding protein 2 [Bacteroidales bacterium]|nr:penicillin-binding protein 2 [Bacteroidales bacterium]
MTKKNIITAGILIAGAILTVKLFLLQVVDRQYKITAENNAYKYITIYPARGIIYDRNGKILVDNKNYYDIMITPMEVSAFDTTDFCRIFSLDIKDVRRRLASYRKHKRIIGFRTLQFLKHVPVETYNVFAEQSYRFPGFGAVMRSTREYPFNAGANLFGYISEADSAFLANHPSYRMGDYMGATGLENAYEKYLKGEKGYNIYVRDVHNRIKSRLENGEYDKSAIPGRNLSISIDGDLQQYGEELMKNKVGSIVAIEPSTGEILAIISSPGIDINELADISKYYNKIINDPYKPMFNRAIMSEYPPGSVFKAVNGLIGLQDSVITPASEFSCHGGFHYGNRKLGCHIHKSPLDFRNAIKMSCNTYFCNVMVAIMNNKKYKNIDERFDHWRKMVMSFGFGKRLGSDLPSELGGNVPSSSYYDKLYGKNRWNVYNIISLSIGQGELGITPLHMANLAAIIANRGYYYVPHIIRNSPDSTDRRKFEIRHYTAIGSSHFKPLIDGMYMAVNSPPGTGGTAGLARVDSLNICGKTGTAQNPHGKDNSVFICFAPEDNPKIAVAVYIENAGFGGTWAAPVASLIIEKYLKGKTGRPYIEKYVMDADLKQNVHVKEK